MKSYAHVILMIFAFVFMTGVYSHSSLADDNNEAAKRYVIEKNVVGEIGYIDSKYLAVVTNRDIRTGTEDEMSFTLNGDVRLVRARGIDRLKIGDTIRLTYDELNEEKEVPYADGSVEKIHRVLERTPKVITFLRPAKADLMAGR